MGFRIQVNLNNDYIRRVNSVTPYAMNITNTTPSISPESGALVVSGGIGANTITANTITANTFIGDFEIKDAVTLDTAQTITGEKTFATAPIMSTIFNTGTLTLPTNTGNIALISDIANTFENLDVPIRQFLTLSNTEDATINDFSHNTIQIENEPSNIIFTNIAGFLDTNFDLGSYTLQNMYIDGKTDRNYQYLNGMNCNVEVGNNGGSSTSIQALSLRETIYAGHTASDVKSINSSISNYGNSSSIAGINSFVENFGSITSLLSLLNLQGNNEQNIEYANILNTNFTNTGTIRAFNSIFINNNSTGTITENVNGISIVDTISQCNSYAGINIDVSNVQATQSIVGLQCNGRLNCNANLQAVSMLGVPDSINFIIPQLQVVSSTLQSDYIGNNFACLLEAKENFDHSGSLFDLGIIGGGFVGQLSVSETKNVSTYSFCGAAGSIIAPSAGTINNLNYYLVKGLYQGGGALTIQNMYAFKIEPQFNTNNDPFGIGNPSNFVNTWGFYNASTSPNYFKQSVIIGNTDVATNSDIALEINSKKAIQLPRLTTSEKNNLNATPGMFIYDETLNQASYYNGTLWINL